MITSLYSSGLTLSSYQIVIYVSLYSLCHILVFIYFSILLLDKINSRYLTPPGFVDEDSPYASGGQKGTYYFEFSRPLRTMDHIQQVRCSSVEFSFQAT